MQARKIRAAQAQASVPPGGRGGVVDSVPAEVIIARTLQDALGHPELKPKCVLSNVNAWFSFKVVE